MASNGSEDKDKYPRKGVNGVLLKKFEATLQCMFSLPSSSNPSDQALAVLMPQYSVQPPRLSELERESLLENAKMYWKKLGLAHHHESFAEEYRVSCDNVESPWPFDLQTSLPSIGHVRQSHDPSIIKAKTTKTKTGKDAGGVGDIMHSQRAWRKEVQLANLIHCVLSLLRSQQKLSQRKHTDCGSVEKKIRIIDFAGGTGHLAVPLALLLPRCEVVCVDLKKWSLDLLHKRVDGFDESKTLNCTSPDTMKPTRTLPNLFTFHGSIQSFSEYFDIGCSLHACGEASDWVLRKCLQKNASFVVCSCCCGKLSRDAVNPYTFHSTGGNKNEITYPQSEEFARLGQFDDNTSYSENNSDHKMSPGMFDEIAKAADYSELGDLRKPRNACRRVAKSLVEWDRLLFVKGLLNTNKQDACFVGDIILTRMVPWEASTKNDILIGWPDSRVSPYQVTDTTAQTIIQRDKSCDDDFQTAFHHLFGENSKGETNACANDWNPEEEDNIKLKIQSFLESDNRHFRFPIGMGSRQRKLIHNVAEKMGLRHWGEGKKEREKTVIIAK